MSRTYISRELRRLVVERAGNLCEYCFIPDTVGVSFQIDHIISEKHGGSTTDGELARFFNPRRDFWEEHFRLDEAAIQPITEIGEVTVRIFDFNNDERIIERQALMEVNRYPSESARQRIIKPTEE